MPDINKRNFVLATTASAINLATPQIIRAQTDPQSHFFAGCYYDTALSETSHAAKYLFTPIRAGYSSDNPYNPDNRGAELSNFARELVFKNNDFCKYSNINKQDEGNPIAISLTRAQHEIITVATPGLPTEYMTVISVTAALDVMTDKAAFRNNSRFESIYCNLIVVNQVVQTRNKLSDSELQKYYQKVFGAAVDELLERAGKKLIDKRERARAVFQVKNMVLPDPLPEDLANLITSGIEASSDNGQEAKTNELKKLGRELQHIYSLMILDALEKQKIKDIAILPPESPWTEGRVVRLLRSRLGLTVDLVSQADASQMNGYEIRAGISKVSRTKAGMNSAIDVSMASRIVRNIEGKLDHKPSSIKDPLKKVASAGGVKRYVELPDFKRGVTRDVTMGSIRDAARGTAVALVPFLNTTASEF